MILCREYTEEGYLLLVVCILPQIAGVVGRWLLLVLFALLPHHG